MTRASWSMLLGLALLSAAVCSSDSGAQVDSKKAGGKGTVVEIDGLKSTTPAEWVEETPTTKLRFKQFRLPKVGEDKEDAMMLVIYLDGQGGSSDENVKRWKGMFA